MSVILNSKITFEQVLEVGAAGAKHHLVSSQCLSSSGQCHVNKVLILEQTFEGICQRGLVMLYVTPFEIPLIEEPT